MAIETIVNKPIAFAVCYALFMLFQVSSTMYTSAILTTLEARYRLSTSTASLILSTSDIAGILSTFLVTYLSHSRHRPRILGIMGLFTALGAALCGLSHALFPAYPDLDNGGPIVNSTSDTNSVHVCAERGEPGCSDDDFHQAGSRLSEAWLLILGQAVMGLAYGPVFPVALTYIDDQVGGTTTPYYVSAFLLAGSASTLLGMGIASFTLRLPIDWPSAEAEFTHQKRLGAWWLGFLMIGAILAVLSLPFFLFPKRMAVGEDGDGEKDFRELQEAKEVGGLEVKEEGTSTPASLKMPGLSEFKGALKRLMSNLTLVPCVLGAIPDMAAAMASSFFLAKYLIIQYQLSPADAPLYTGFIMMPSSMIASIFSGLVVRRLGPTVRGCGLLVISAFLVVLICIPVLFFLGCQDPQYSGFIDGLGTPWTSCNEKCSCSRDQYLPVCGSDNVSYSTPCFAGCTGQRSERNPDHRMENITIYTGCACSSGEGASLSDEAVPGVCSLQCNLLWPALAFLFLLITFGAMSKNPTLIMIMRCVEEKDKTFALGVTSVLSRAIGFLPAPLYFGAAVDTTCQLKREACGITSDCFIYNGRKFRLVFLGLVFGLNMLSLICFALATVNTTIEGRTRQREGKMEELEESKTGESNGFVNGAFQEDIPETGVQTDTDF